MKNEDGTVTIPLEVYEQMKKELKTLRHQVQQKTVIKYTMHPIYAYVVMAGMILIIFWKLIS